MFNNNKDYGWLVKLAGILLNRPRKVLFVATLLVVLGVVSWVILLPRQGFPPTSTPLIFVEVTAGGLSAEEVDKSIVQTLSKTINANFKGVDNIEANSFDNGAFVALTLDDSLGAETVAAEFNQLTKKLNFSTNITIESNSFDASKFIGKYSLILVATNPDLSKGNLDQEASLFIDDLTAFAEIDSAEVIEQTAQLSDGNLTQTNFSRFGDKPSDRGVNTLSATMIGLISADGVDDIKQSHVVSELIADLETKNGTKLSIGADPAPQIEEQIDSLFNNLAGGLLAVTLVTFLLIAIRASILTAIFISVVVMVTFFIMFLIGFTINTISLFALVLALGLFVDDATIVVEAAERSATAGNKTRVDIAAIKRIAMASMAGTLTTILVFLPLAFLSGILGDFIRVMPITISIALLVSLSMSLFVLPIGLRFMFRKRTRRWLIARQSTKYIDWFAEKLGSFYKQLAARTLKGVIVALLAVGLSIGFFLIGSAKFSQLPINIFPTTNDSNDLILSIVYPPGTTIDEANEIAAQADAAIASVLRGNQRNTLYFEGNVRSAIAAIHLSQYHSRDISAIEFARLINAKLANIEGAKLEIAASSVGPPANEYPFLLQIYDENPLPATELASDIVRILRDAIITRSSGRTAIITDARIDSPTTVFRNNGRRFIQVEATFDDVDVSALTIAAQNFVEAEYSPEKITSFGLSADSIEFDFGFESENQASFSSLLVALPIAIIAMYVLLTIQFGSFLQPLLVFLAIPFSIFGVAFGLSAAGYGVSFFTMFGFLGLIGIAVNNTILLVDYANQERRKGASSTVAITEATKLRLRPLLTTTLTTVAALLPLAISDPFWQPLAITIMFGLISSTFLVIVSFPYYYLAAYWLTSRMGRLLKRRISA